jgi:hypothetical protein
MTTLSRWISIVLFVLLLVAASLLIFSGGCERNA